MDLSAGTTLFRTRWAGAIRRRVRYGWRRLRDGRRPPPVEAAWRWLADRSSGQGTAGPAEDPTLTAATMETAWLFGFRGPACQQARWLVSIQRPDGAIPEIPGGEASLPSTSVALRGWIRLVDELPELEGPAQRAAATLYRHSGGQTSRGPASRGPAPEPAAGQLPAVAGGHWPAFGPLFQAGVRWSRPEWSEAARSAVGEMTQRMAAARGHRLGPAECPLAWLLHRAEEYAAVGDQRAARRLLAAVVPCQGASGGIRERLRTGPIRPASVAWAAALWYRCGPRRAADRAMAFLQRQQGPGGGFPGRAGSGWGTGDDPWAVKYYLDAAWARVRTAFEATWAELPDRIDPEDGRVKAVLRWFAGFDPGARVADVGCGTGRFLRRLVQAYPQADLTGIDICHQALERLPSGVTPCPGSVLRIPAADGAFDGAYAVESLEHALVPEQAVAELCRVVRPGGRLLVIDKDRARQPLSECEPWERWFRPEELANWLTPFCRDVTVQRVSHREGRPGRDLFLAAAGTRRG